MSNNYPRTMYVDTEPDAETSYYSLRLYIAGQTDKSIAARSNLRRFCEANLSGRYDLEVIDLEINPQRAAEDRILATPTLVRRLPRPVRRIVGDMSNVEKLLVSLEIRRKTGFT
jgi:circadian clock protein KaiB